MLVTIFLLRLNPRKWKREHRATAHSYFVLGVDRGQKHVEESLDCIRTSHKSSEEKRTQSYCKSYVILGVVHGSETFMAQKHVEELLDCMHTLVS